MRGRAEGPPAPEDGGPAAARWAAPAVPRSVAELRAHAVDFARSSGADDAVTVAVRLAVSEAVTNAVMHAFVDRDPGTVTLACDAGPGELRMQVTDDGRGTQPRVDSPGLGSGLSTMGHVVQRLEVRSGPGGAGTTVVLVFRAPGVRGPGRAVPDDRAGRLLLAASALARSAAWPDDGVAQLAALAVPEHADVACVDLAEDGTLRRLAALVDRDPELTERLRAGPPPAKPGTATWAALQGEGPRLVVHDPTVPRSPTGPGEMLDLGWWLAVPLTAPDGRVLALWGLGGRGDRPAPDAGAVALLAEAAQRAAGGLAHAQLLAGAQATRHRLERVLDLLGEAVCVADPGGVLVYANPAAVRLLGRPGADLAGAGIGAWLERVRLTDATGRPLAADELPIARAGRGEEPAPLLTRCTDRGTGQVTWLRTTARPLAGADAGHVVAVVEDLTGHVRAQEQADVLERVRELLASGAQPDSVLARIAALLAASEADGPPGGTAAL